MELSNVIPMLKSRDSNDISLALELLHNFPDEIKKLTYQESKEIYRLCIDCYNNYSVENPNSKNIWNKYHFPYRDIINSDFTSKKHRQWFSNHNEEAYMRIHKMPVHNKLLTLLEKIREIGR